MDRPAPKMAKVRGDSMVTPDGGGYPDGVMLEVQPGLQPRSGDLVLAETGPDAAYFRLVTCNGAVVMLEAFNPSYPPMPVTSQTRFLGVVTASIVRKAVPRGTGALVKLERAA